jgi:hypothetical protein
MLHFHPSPMIREGQILADVVEKVAVWMMVIVVVSHLASGDLLDMPSSIQMMDFTG